MFWLNVRRNGSVHGPCRNMVATTMLPALTPSSSSTTLSPSLPTPTTPARIGTWISTRTIAPVSLRGGTRYLNASWVLELHGGKWWVATQAPLPDTANAFLTFVMNPITTPASPHHCRIRTVVQLTRHSEAGRVKAHPYFPSVVGQSAVLEAGGAPPPQGHHSQGRKNQRCVVHKDHCFCLDGIWRSDSCLSTPSLRRVA